MVLGLTPVTSAKDGNCLYESFARACNNGHAVGVDQMRSRIVVATQSNAELCARIEACEGGDVAAYLARMSTNRTWGAEPEIRAFADLYGVNVRIYGFSPKVKVIVSRCLCWRMSGSGTNNTHKTQNTHHRRPPMPLRLSQPAVKKPTRKPWR